MIRFNATVKSGFTNRDGEFVHFVKPDKGDVVQVKHWAPLDENKRVLLRDGRIEDVQ